MCNIAHIRNHISQATITPVYIDAFIADPQKMLNGVNHVVVSGTLDKIKFVVKLACEIGFNLGALLTESQRKASVFTSCQKDLDATIDLALRNDPTALDLVQRNGHTRPSFIRSIGNLRAITIFASAKSC